MSENDNTTMKTHPMPMNLKKWINHFGTANRLNRNEPCWDAPLRLSEKKRIALAATLAEYQLGDGGGPCRLIARDAEALRATDEDVRRVVDLWFMEEAEHSRLLGGALRRLNGTFITTSFGFRWFNRCRRLLGAQFEMLLLLIVEIVSTAYYWVVCRHCDDEPVAEMCRLILRDEAGHVSFHRERLTSRHPDGVSKVWAAGFFFLGYSCTAFLWLGHGFWLRQIGVTRVEMFGRVNKGLVRFLSRLRAESIAVARRRRSSGLRSATSDLISGEPTPAVRPYEPGLKASVIPFTSVSGASAYQIVRPFPERNNGFFHRPSGWHRRERPWTSRAQSPHRR